MSEKKYILLQSGYKVSYDNAYCYENDKTIDNITGEVTKEIAEKLQQTLYNNLLRRHFRNIVVLTAAGTSLDNGENGGKTRDGLWGYCRDEIKNILKKISPCNLKLKNIIKNRDIEALLSYIILFEKINGELIDEKSQEPLKEKLEQKIVEACNLKLDKLAPHQEFLDKITARKSSDRRIELFTTNYDTLFEEAANEAGFVVIDGFSFTHPRKFSGRYFDLDVVNREKTRIKQEESFISKVILFYKLHGSLNWVKEGKNILQKDNPVKPLIIYPASDKYESSYEQPYFEMMSRFQQALRKEDTLLIVLGFGFQDKHIQNVIIEAVDQNPSFQLVIVNYNNTGGILSNFLEPFFSDLSEMEVKRNVNIVFDTFSSFTKKYPTNQTYLEQQNNPINEAILP